MTDALDAVNAYRYVSFTTFRKTGAAVSTPVWIARDGDELLFVSEDDTGKVKRLRNNSAVELRECTMRGAVADGATVYAGTATVHRDEASMRRARAATARKCPEARLGNLSLSLLGRVGLVKTPRVAVVIRLAD